MTNRRKAIFTITGIPILGIIILLFSLYPFLAENNPTLRPFGWFNLPQTQPYTEGTVAPEYRDAADYARVLLQAQVREVNVPAFSAAIAINGKLIWSAAIGYANLEERHKATPGTLFRIGSTSKAVTGTLFARMVDDSLISIDAPISTYIKDLPNPDWAQITPRQLASHTAGIVGYEENNDLIGAYGSMRLQSSHSNVSEGLDYFDDADLLYEPGTDFHYSSYDVNLLSVVLEEAGGTSFLELLRKKVLEPLDLDSPKPDAPQKDRAAFYHVQDGKAQRWRDVDLSMKLASGGYMATPSDLALLGAAWLNDEFISPETRQQFWEPQKLANGSVNEQNYALNWRFSPATADIPFDYMHHGGVSKGAMAWLAIIPEYNMAIALTINTRVWPFSRWSGVFTNLVQTFADSSKAAMPSSL
jgi:CubicO group peptidase (beta-lactamase class C family)